MTQAHGRGRPLRFLLVVMLCWGGARMAASHDWWSSGSSRPLSVLPAAGASVRAKRKSRTVGHVSPFVQASGRGWHRYLEHASQRRPSIRHASGTVAINAPSPAVEAPNTPSPTPGQIIPGAPLLPQSPSGNRWSMSGWLFWRDAGGASLAGGGQLGGSQAGVRMAYQLLPDSPERLAVYGRLTSALRRPHAPEAAIGWSVQPLRAIAARVAVERRMGLGSGARDAFAAMAVGGIGPWSLPGKLVLEGYGQAGIVGMRSRDAFADGKMTVLRAVGDTLPLSVGLSMSGGVQPQVARLDIGPQVEAKLKLGGQPARISAEWRQRVAGNARPGSGPAITLAADF